MSMLKAMLMKKKGSSGTLNLVSVGGASVDNNFIYEKQEDEQISYFYQDIDLSNFDYTTDDIEIVAKVKLTNGEYTGAIYTPSNFGGSINNFCFSVFKLNDLSGSARAIDNSFDVDFSSVSSQITSNDWFYIKLTFTHSINLVRVLLSSDNINWTVAGSYTQNLWLSVIKEMNKVIWGIFYNTSAEISQGFKGSIDFRECYFKVNNDFIWQGVI